MPISNHYEQFICLIEGSSLSKIFILFVTVMEKLFEQMDIGNMIINETKL